MNGKVLISITLLFLSWQVQSQSISFTSDELYPEGLAYDSVEQVFYVSSIHQSSIGKVDRKGNYTQFVKNNSLYSTVGILVDSQRKLLYACVSDPGIVTHSSASTKEKLARLDVYHLEDATLKFSINLSELNPDKNNFANDIAMDNAGNLYITNSLSPLIFKVQQNGTSEIFARSKLWEGENYNLNGICFHQNKYLIVSKENSGELFKVPLHNPSKVTKIKAPPILGADGIIYINEEEIAVISNVDNSVTFLQSNNNWHSAKVTSTQNTTHTFPTTGVKIGDKIYVLNAKLNELFSSEIPNSSQFLLQEINIPKTVKLKQ